MPKRTHPLRPFLFFCQVWAIGPSWAPIKSLCRLSQLAHKTSSVVPVWTAVFIQDATATGMIGGSALRPIACRKSTGPTINGRPSVLPAIGASTCAISAEGCSGPPLLPIGIRIATQLFPGPFPLGVSTSRSFMPLRKALGLSKVERMHRPDTSISLLRTILAGMMMRSSGKPLSEPGDNLLAKLGALYIRRRNLRRPRPRSRPRPNGNSRLARRGIKPAPVAQKPKRLRTRPFVQLSEN